MRIKVDYLGHVKDIVGVKDEEIEMQEKVTIRDLLDMLSAKHGNRFKKAVYESGCSDLRTNYIATVNGQLLNQLEGINTKLKDQDEVKIMPIVSGG